MKQKRRLSAAEKAAKKARRKRYAFVFINGKQKRVLREPTVDGLPLDEFTLHNADPIWLHMNGMWEYLDDLDRSARPDS